MVKKTKLSVGDVAPNSKVESKDTLLAYRTEAQQEAMIAKAAYFKAMQRNFVAGHEMDDWLAAEADIYGLVY